MPCKLWEGAATRGRGVVRVGGQNVYVYRLAYCKANGKSLDDIRGVVIRHKCDVSLCYEETHLVAGAQKQNIRDAVDRGQMPKGEQKCNAILTEEKVREIRVKYKAGAYQRELAAEYGVSPDTIRSCVNRKSWKHVK